MNEKEFQNNIYNETRNIKLTERERIQMRAKILQFMEGASASVRKVEGETSSRVTRKNRRLQGLNKTHMIIGAIIALFIGGSTAFAAEGSIPGDKLYPIKIHINEEVRDWVEITDSAQAKWEAKKAERRIQEAKKLESKGELSTEVRTELGVQISANAHAVGEEAKKLRKAGKREEATQLHTEFSNLVRTEARALGITVSTESSEHREVESDDDQDEDDSIVGGGSTTTTSDSQKTTEIEVETTEQIKIEQSGESDTNINARGEIRGELKAGIGL